MGFALSPGVTTKEHDLSTTIPAVATSLGAMVGMFTKGPMNTPVVITTENELVSTFGTPTNDTAASFYTAANFLSYGNNLKVVRVGSSTGLNAASGSDARIIANQDDFENATLLADFVYAKSAGDAGNNVSVEYADSTAFTTWAYKDSFQTSPVSTNDEVCVAVFDDDVLVETWIVSVTEGNTDSGGNSIFMDDILANRSGYVYMVSANITDETPATLIALAGGVSSTDAITAGSWTTGWEEFRDAELIDVNLLLAGACADQTVDMASTVQKFVVELAEDRKDCVAFVSPPKSLLVGKTAADAVSDMQDWRTATGAYGTDNMNINSSYGFLDGNYKYQYDKYNDKYRWVPLSGDMAGLCVFTDNSKDAWWSPAGLNRGNVKGVVKLAIAPTKGLRDELYKSPYGINPVISMPGQGTVLWGDKTMLTKPSAFDRINVRRLFIVLEKAIAKASKYMLFEFNDQFTRSQFLGMVNPFLKDVKGRRGVYDFLVVCDETNNTGEVIDRNEFIADIYIKPARSINFITLNFIATKTGVEFNELFGAV